MGIKRFLGMCIDNEYEYERHVYYYEVSKVNEERIGLYDINGNQNFGNWVVIMRGEPFNLLFEIKHVICFFFNLRLAKNKKKFFVIPFNSHTF